MSTATISPSSPPAQLEPKEHGAYAILGVPIATAFAVSGLTLAGLCVAIAAIAGFLAHEPLLVAWGHRGSRAQRTTPEARKRLVVLLTITVASGSIALLVGDQTLRLALVVCAACAASSFAIAMTGKHRTIGGQLWGILGLSIPCVPILLAGGVSTAQTIEIWAVLVLGFVSTTMAVRGVIASQKRRSRAIHWFAITILSVLFGVLTWRGVELSRAALPMLLMSWYLMIDPPPAKQLKRVGWSLVAGTIATAAWMVFLVR